MLNILSRPKVDRNVVGCAVKRKKNGSIEKISTIYTTENNVPSIEREWLVLSKNTNDMNMDTPISTRAHGQSDPLTSFIQISFLQDTTAEIGKSS